MNLGILDGKDTHVLMTICQKDGKWQDEDASCSDVHSSKCKVPAFKSLGKDQMGFRKVNHVSTGISTGSCILALKWGHSTF